jgi:nitrous oxide reductase
MADWPDLDTLKLILDVSQDDFDAHLTGVLDAAIEQVKIDVAGSAASFDAVDSDYTITDSLAAAAKLLAVRVAKAPAESSEAVTWAAHRQDVNYQRLLKGQRGSFGIA